MTTDAVPLSTVRTARTTRVEPAVLRRADPLLLWLQACLATGDGLGDLAGRGVNPRWRS